ncbi:hypothetical protein BJ322DRAFT_1040349 [Thelephora terrestris]|uniref:Uncharacterized protein n=1 Tax=Thelephora terrestris TaxID=56493 RepID=A0A9P6LBF1_9AGAM|nr:hypothetical protein BJ322DRAFT_1040349 [Thelephora terrestris]
MYYNLSMAFDVIVFLIIIFTARRPRMNAFPGMPSILDTLVRDATQYFILIFSFHFLATLFLFVTPANIQLFPGMANSILVPIMASRLMLSLKKASVRPGALWSLETMTNADSERPAEGGPRRDPGRFHKIPLTPAAALDEDAIELGVAC